jgi:hypothetical protein
MTGFGRSIQEGQKLPGAIRPAIRPAKRQAVQRPHSHAVLLRAAMPDARPGQERAPSLAPFARGPATPPPPPPRLLRRPLYAFRMFPPGRETPKIFRKSTKNGHMAYTKYATWQAAKYPSLANLWM